MTIPERALVHFGKDRQIQKAIEELTELSLALQRAVDGRADVNNILEEMADVHIMLEQLAALYGSPESWLKEKLTRLEVRIAKEGARAQ